MSGQKIPGGAKGGFPIPQTTLQALDTPSKDDAGFTQIPNSTQVGVSARLPGLTAKATVGTGSPIGQRQAQPISSVPWVRFSEAPNELGKALADEIRKTFEFARNTRNSFVFFGGARVKESDPAFAEGMRWGEAVFAINLGALAPQTLVQAAAAGLFSKEAVTAARAASLAVGAGIHGPAALGQALQIVGDSSSHEGAAAALALLQGRTVDPEAVELLMTLTKTGAGPGIMEAVPLGYLSARAKVAKMFPEVVEPLAAEMTTLGASIKLPNEQRTSPTIETLEQFIQLLPRRIALTEQAAGFVVKPGGFGTLNELFEVWREGKPTALQNREFWGEIVDTLKAKWSERGLVNPKRLDQIGLVDDAHEGLAYLLSRSKAAGGPEVPSIERAERMAQDIQRGLTTLSHLPAAVTFLGGKRLKASDAEVHAAQQIASALAKSGIPARIGGYGAIVDAVVDGVKGSGASGPASRVQGLIYDHGDLDHQEVHEKIDVCEVVHSGPVHKLLLYENTDAIVALPGGVGTFDEVFEIACLMKVDKIPKRPLVLVGKDFWQPFLDACSKQMLNDERQLIGPDFMKLFTVTDDANEAARTIRKHRAQIEEQLS